MSEANDLDVDLFQKILAKLEKMEHTLDSLLYRLDKSTTTMSKPDTRTKNIKINGEGYKTSPSSDKNHSDLEDEQNASNTETTIPRSKTKEAHEDVKSFDKQPILPVHQGLVNCTEVIKEGLHLTSEHKPLLPAKAIEILVSQLTQMEEDGHLDSFKVNPHETTFSQQDPTKIFVALYRTMARVKNEKDTFHMVPIVFSAASMAAAGGFDFSNTQHAYILTTLAIESQLYMEFEDLYTFLMESKHVIFNFLMNDLGWKRHEELADSKTLENIIATFDNIKAIPIHKTLEFVYSSKNIRGNNAVSSNIGNSSKDINDKYETNKLNKGRFPKEGEFWIDKIAIDALNNLSYDPVNSNKGNSKRNKNKKRLKKQYLHRPPTVQESA